MSIYSPPADWFKPPSGAERLWVGLALCWCLIMSLAMPYWHFYGKQNSTGESYKISVADYGTRVRQFVESLARENPGGRLVLVVHSGVIKALVPDANPANTDSLEVTLREIRVARPGVTPDADSIV